MSVDIDTDRAALAGSTGINAPDLAQDDEPGTSVDRRADAAQDGTIPKGRRQPGKSKDIPSRPLVLICERCGRAVVGSGAGFAYVDLRQAQQVLHRIARGYHDPVRAPWTLAHRQCAPQPLRALSPYYCVWSDMLTTVDDLLDAFVTLSRTDWLAGSDWGSLVRRINADTESAMMPSLYTIERRAREASQLKALQSEPMEKAAAPESCQQRKATRIIQEKRC